MERIIKCKKVSFSDETFAEIYVKKLCKTSIREVKPIRSYLCPICLNWHLTSIEYVNKTEKYLQRQIENLKAKVLHLQNENNILTRKLTNQNHSH